MLRAFTYAVLIVIFFSCKKKDTPPPAPLINNGNSPDPIAPDIENARYKSGTYWVYYDSITNTIDSLAVGSYRQDLVSNQSGGFHYYTFNVFWYPSLKKDSFLLMQSYIW